MVELVFFQHTCFLSSTETHKKLAVWSPLISRRSLFLFMSIVIFFLVGAKVIMIGTDNTIISNTGAVISGTLKIRIRKTEVNDGSFPDLVSYSSNFISVLFFSG